MTNEMIKIACLSSSGNNLYLFYVKISDWSFLSLSVQNALLLRFYTSLFVFDMFKPFANRSTYSTYLLKIIFYTPHVALFGQSFEARPLGCSTGARGLHRPP